MTAALLLGVAVALQGAAPGTGRDARPELAELPADSTQPGTPRLLDDGMQGPFGPGGIRWRVDTFVSEPSDPARSVFSVGPTVWWNEETDVTVGLRLRTNYQGRFNRLTLNLFRGVGGRTAATEGDAVDFYLRYENPMALRSDRWGQFVEGWMMEGTVGARLGLVSAPGDAGGGSMRHGTKYTVGWVATRENDFLDPALWDNAGTIELERADRWVKTGATTRWTIGLLGTAGWRYRRGAAAGESTYQGEPFGRLLAHLAVRKDLLGFTVGARVFGGGYLGDETPLPQRAIQLHGADPYQTLGNPFLRTRGAPLVSSDVFYHSPGHANMRGYEPGLGGRWAVSANLEIERHLIRRQTGVFRGVSVIGFGDGATVDTVAVPSFVANAYRTLYDAGVGIRATFHVGDVTFPLRVEFPFYVSEALYAHHQRGGNAQKQFRWLVSLQPIF